MCESARAEFDPKGLVIDCERYVHHCAGPRTPVWFEAHVYDRDGNRIEWSSRIPHCSSCASDEEYYGSCSDDPCCCIHRAEHDDAKAVA